MSLPQVIQITDRDSGATARILVSLGFNCFSWRPVLRDGPREMLWAEHQFDQGDKRPSGSGIPLLFPFPGRIGGARFTFEGREFQLEPGDPWGNAIHGFVFNRPWRIVEQSDARVVGQFQASIDDPQILTRWPADFRIQVAYEVRGNALVSDIRYENVGTTVLPCGFGTHAYFRLPLAEGSDVAETIVIAPIHKRWEADEMLPTGHKLPLADDLPLAAGLRLGDRQFDTYFTDLKPDPDGLIRTQLRDPRSSRTLTQVFERSFSECIIYTPGHREAICLEPYTCIPDAFRLEGEKCATGLQRLDPGEAFETTIRIDIDDDAAEGTPRSAS